MAIQLKPVSEQVVVVTGASSGIGLATARAAAAAGARVVLAARSADALQQAVEAIQAKGGDAIHVVADVSKADDLRRVADAAIERFGRIDTWVNNAGVGIWGTIEETTEDDMRRLFETNFWGEVHGSLAALPHLKRHGGALINVGSMGSDRAIPLQGIYSASKHAVKGFTDALRVELEREKAPVSVTLIKPGSIGTPMPQHVRNYTDREAKLPPPIYAPEDVAATILHAAAHPMRNVSVGGQAWVGSMLSQVAPGLVDWVSAKFLVDAQLGRKRRSAGDNLDHGYSHAKVRGDHQGSLIRRSLSTQSMLHPAATALTLGAAAVGIAAYALRGRRR